MSKILAYVFLTLMVSMLILSAAQAGQTDKAAGSKPLTLLFFHVYG
jgi:hypothetical protein